MSFSIWRAWSINIYLQFIDILIYFRYFTQISMTLVDIDCTRMTKLSLNAQLWLTAPFMLWNVTHVLQTLYYFYNLLINYIWKKLRVTDTLSLNPPRVFLGLSNWRVCNLKKKKNQNLKITQNKHQSHVTLGLNDKLLQCYRSRITLSSSRYKYS